MMHLKGMENVLVERYSQQQRKQRNTENIIFSNKLMKQMEQSKQVFEQSSYALMESSKIRVKDKSLWIAILDFVLY